jgi:hypothetical protein
VYPILIRHTRVRYNEWDFFGLDRDVSALYNPFFSFYRQLATYPIRSLLRMLRHRLPHQIPIDLLIFR